MQRLILASESPRRKELLSLLGLPFEIVPSDVDEYGITNCGTNAPLLPDELVKKLSDAKATAVSDMICGDAVIIAADTVVFLKDEILGKPSGEKSAFEMLKKLQGQTHHVHTGVTIIKKSGTNITKKQFAESTAVNMASLSDSEIQAYIDTGEPFDKAGAYAIQGKGAFFVSSIEGDYNNVVGLPLFALYRALKEIGL